MTPDNSPSEEQSPELRAALHRTENGYYMQPDAAFAHMIEDNKALAKAVRDLQGANAQLRALLAGTHDLVKWYRKIAPEFGSPADAKLDTMVTAALAAKGTEQANAQTESRA